MPTEVGIHQPFNVLTKVSTAIAEALYRDSFHKGYERLKKRLPEGRRFRYLVFA